jgi:excisionase family DNA binding protein
MTSPEVTKPQSHSRSPHHWMTSAQAAEHIGVHVNFLRTVPATELPFYLMGRNRRYKMADVEAYIASRVVTK